MKKKFLVLSLLLILVAIFAVMLYLHWPSNDAISEKDTYDKNIDILNESFPTDIVVIGEEIPFRDALIIRKIGNITGTALQTNKERQIIILSDIDGTLEISDNELLVIKDKLDAHACDFYYLGTTLNDRLISLGFLDTVWPSNDYCIALVNQEGKQLRYTGIWTESDKQATGDNRESLGHVLVSHFVFVLKGNN